MKFKNISFLFASLCLVLSACESDDETNGSGGIPEGALPSTEFTPNNLPDEPYADDVIKVVAESEDAPFYSLELMADGHYLLSLQRPSSVDTKTISVNQTADGAFSIGKHGKSSAIRTRSVSDENGTINIGYGEMFYGPFVKTGDYKYRLSNGIEVEFSEFSSSIQNMKYSTPNGLVVIKIRKVETLLDSATRSLCRTWNYNSFEVWGYINGAYVVHGKQALVNGDVVRQFQASNSSLFEIEEDDFLENDDELCYKVIFSQNGTYMCFYRDNTTEVYAWQWHDLNNGIIHTWDPMENYLDKQDHLYSNVRFAGKQMRVYNDNTESEGGISCRTIAVETLTAAQ